MQRDAICPPDWQTGGASLAPQKRGYASNASPHLKDVLVKGKGLAGLVRKYHEVHQVSTLNPPSIDQGLPRTATNVGRDQDLQQVIEIDLPHIAIKAVKDQDLQQGLTGILREILSNIAIAVIPAAPLDQDATITVAVTDQIPHRAMASVPAVEGQGPQPDSHPRDYHEFKKDDFQPGTIIRAPIHEEDMRRTPRPRSDSNSSCRSRASSHVSHTDFGPVYSENRLFIVVEQFAAHYLAVPLFTYQGTGLRNEHDVKEYASIEDHRFPGSSKKAAPHLLITGEMKPTARPMKPESVAHLTYPVSRKYKLHVSYQGRLREEDIELLVKLFRNGGSL